MWKKQQENRNNNKNQDLIRFNCSIFLRCVAEIQLTFNELSHLNPKSNYRPFDIPTVI